MQTVLVLDDGEPLVVDSDALHKFTYASPRLAKILRHMFANTTSSSTRLHQFNEPHKTKSLPSRRRLKGRDMNKGQSLPTGSELERLLVVETEQKRSHLRNFLQVGLGMEEPTEDTLEQLLIQATELGMMGSVGRQCIEWTQKNTCVKAVQLCEKYSKEPIVWGSVALGRLRRAVFPV
eukprot:g4109.t1